ncbi:YihY/virulence factor BrkB family protein [uncultured Flavonifractor sp.]|uniref:YihY/virulence factor BrkB family protein n=1 Tax=uncultured Flavonifractor sp. TaxID=1193534 RepID=UPI002639305A|nr:YihY/virulence factor BrkB family protein [uncultured Flavonifractor sp.]
MPKRLLQKKPVKFILEMTDLYFSKHISRSAAELAYFLILSFFPLLICVNAFIVLLPVDLEAVLAAAAPLLPKAAYDILGEYVGYITTNQSPGLLAAGIFMTLFFASAAFRALMNIMEEIYSRKGYRGFRQIVASVLFALLLLVTIFLSLVVLLTGGWLFQEVERLLHLDAGVLPWDWQWMRFLLLFLLVFLFVLLVYRVAAPRGKPRPPVMTGAFLAAVALSVFSILFSWFIGLSSRYSLVYGSLASIIILLVWLYLCGNILILGNVFNCVWYRHKKLKLLKELKKEER